MRWLVSLGLLSALVTGAFGCGVNDDRGPVEPGAAIAAAGDVRFSLPTSHRVVVERRTTEGWSDARIVFEDPGRECGMVHAIAAGRAVAATVDCDERISVDQAPTRSVALISANGGSWAHRDLDGEAYGTPGLSPEGGHAVWVQADDLLTWEAGSFDTAPQPSNWAQVVTVDDRGTILAIAVGTSAGQCSLEVRTNEADFPQVVVPIARADELPCRELELALTQPTEIRGDLSGQLGTEFVVRNTSTGGWAHRSATGPYTGPGCVLRQPGHRHLESAHHQHTGGSRGGRIPGPTARHRPALRPRAATVDKVPGRAHCWCPQLSAQGRRLRSASRRNISDAPDL